MDTIQEELHNFLQQHREQNAVGLSPTPQWEDIPESEPTENPEGVEDAA